MTVRVAVAVVMLVIVSVMMAVPVAMMGPVLDPGIVGVTRVLAEYQRLDRDRDGVRRQPDAPQVDVVEIPQRHAVYHQQLVRKPVLLLEYRPQGLRDAAIEQQVERLAVRDGAGQALDDAPRERG